MARKIAQPRRTRTPAPPTIFAEQSFSTPVTESSTSLSLRFKNLTRSETTSDNFEIGPTLPASFQFGSTITSAPPPKKTKARRKPFL